MNPDVFSSDLIPSGEQHGRVRVVLGILFLALIVWASWLKQRDEERERVATDARLAKLGTDLSDLRYLVETKADARVVVPMRAAKSEPS